MVVVKSFIAENAETLRHKEIMINSSKNFIAENAKAQRRRDFVILTICCVSIGRLGYSVKCNSVTLKGENFSRGERRDFVIPTICCVSKLKRPVPLESFIAKNAKKLQLGS